MTVLRMARKCLPIVCFATAMMTLVATSSVATSTGLNAGAPATPRKANDVVAYDYSCDCRIPICRYSTQKNCYVNASACYVKKCERR
jgi:hypothetical protein